MLLRQTNFPTNVTKSVQTSNSHMRLIYLALLSVLPTLFCSNPYCLSRFFLRGGVQLITAGSWRWVRWSWRWTGRPWGAASTGTPHASSQRPSRPKRGTTWTSWWPILTWRYSWVEEETTWHEEIVYCFKWHNSFKQTQRNRLISEPFSLDIWFFITVDFVQDSPQRVTSALWDLMH